MTDFDASNEAGAAAIDGSDLRIIVDNGEYWLVNKGDLAMLDVTVGRLGRRWPKARIGVVTYEPSLLRAYAPGAEPVAYHRGGPWPHLRRLGKVPELLGPRLVGPLSRAWRASTRTPRRYTRRMRDTLRMILRLRRCRIDEECVPLPGGAPVSAALEDSARSGHTQRVRGNMPAALSGASLVLAMGGGYLADVDRDQAHRTLDLLEQAADRSIPTAMVGQGLGPMEDPELLARAAAVLPKVNLIALREDRRGPELLRRLGVGPKRVLVTGDDAVELAYGMRRDQIGTGLGVCLRVGVYSPVTCEVHDTVKRVVRRCAEEIGAGLVPLIVSEYESQDRRSTLPLVQGYPLMTPPLGPYATPRQLISQVSRCRVVITGAYHAAVFALSQGIPVVGLTASRYYDDKLLGLVQMFQGGLRPVKLVPDRLEDRLTDAIRRASAEAPARRESLRKSAYVQIQAGKQAYERIFRLVEFDQGNRRL